MAQKYGEEDRERLTSPGVGRRSGRNQILHARVCVDIHPVARGYVHWLIADIGPQLSSLPEGAPSSNGPGFIEIKPYAGPFPPSGTHDYELTLYALQTDRLDVKRGATLQEFRQAAEHNSLGTATLIGKFSKIRYCRQPGGWDKIKSSTFHR
jgi:Raf kinase inhibitor-like YbhB/YbcL family protein